MTGLQFDKVTQQLGRRRALQALGTAAIATASGVALAEGKKGKNNGKNRKKNQKVQQRIDEQSLARCASQVTQCDALIAESCEGDAGCVAQGQRCCDLLATCAFTEFIACISTT
ncbi:MAG: hypothetical protein KC442_21465 [Thermomicrobiales bacterium]|nr:hypothetical protein [Thermomicrobiales bacterium]